MFTKIQIYCKSGCCFSDIEESSKPNITINIDQICSLEPREIWPFCEDRDLYPYRRLNMKNGDSFLVVLESANKLEEMLLNGVETTSVPLIHVKEENYWPAGDVPVDEEKLINERKEIR